ncbi:Uncharacterised protein [Vibrio cholerae]|nr:Uncharacterised protein [Vibrio cholerae]CSI50356.1 Uncharacterised protein [Vibrio cholerae]
MIARGARTVLDNARDGFTVAMQHIGIMHNTGNKARIVQL